MPASLALTIVTILQAKKRGAAKPERPHLPAIQQRPADQQLPLHPRRNDQSDIYQLWNTLCTLSTAGRHCCVLLRFCLSGGFCHGEVYKQLSRICAVYVRILSWQISGPCIFRSYTYVFSRHIRTLYERIRTQTYRLYVVRMCSYMRLYMFVCVRIFALYRRYTYVYEQDTCTYGCVRIGFWVAV